MPFEKAENALIEHARWPNRKLRADRQAEILGQEELHARKHGHLRAVIVDPADGSRLGIRAGLGRRPLLFIDGGYGAV